jgi:hypothetical protein
MIPWKARVFWNRAPFVNVVDDDHIGSCFPRGPKRKDQQF